MFIKVHVIIIELKLYLKLEHEAGWQKYFNMIFTVYGVRVHTKLEPGDRRNQELDILLVELGFKDLIKFLNEGNKPGLSPLCASPGSSSNQILTKDRLSLGNFS